ncbi:MAG: hypothetical protein K1W17_02760 [Oscillospiraceae bacterium]
MNKFNIYVSIIVAISILGILALAILFFINVPANVLEIISIWTGIIGTSFSVILSIMAMCYSNKSSKDAEESLKKITDQYEALCTELKNREIQNSLGIDSINRVLSSNQKQ